MPKRTYKVPRRKLPKSRVWGEKLADTKFSNFIRSRDGKCMFPGCGTTYTLQNSHYIGRRTQSTRFDPDNCITLCWRHHYGDKQIGWEFQKQELEKHGYDGFYTKFMKKHLGPKRYQALLHRAKLSIPGSRARIACMQLCGKLPS